IFTNGVGLESSWFDPLSKDLKSGAQLVKLADAAQLQIEKGDEEEPQGDSHVWQDPTNAQKMVNAIRDTLAKVDPAGAATYTANANAYDQQLDQLDQSIKQQIDTLPAEQRKLVTNHDAFGYYIKRYGLTFV